MKKNDLFEKAKQAVAEKHFCDTWADLLIIADNVGADLDIFYQEVSAWVANEAVKEKDVVVEKVTSRLCDMFRLLNKHLNKHPEIFSDLDRMRIGAAQSTIEKYAKPFDPKQVLRQSDSPLPFPQQPDEL